MDCGLRTADSGLRTTGFGLRASGVELRHAPTGPRADAGAAESFTGNADYGGADYDSRRREHAGGTSQLTELAASGPHAARAASSGTGPPSRKALRRGLAVALAEAEIGGDPRECLRRTRSHAPPVRSGGASRKLR